MSRWYLYRNGANYGPYSLNQLREMAQNKTLSKDDFYPSRRNRRVGKGQKYKKDLQKV